jgi:hypothetical protein
MWSGFLRSYITGAHSSSQNLLMALSQIRAMKRCDQSVEVVPLASQVVRMVSIFGGINMASVLLPYNLKSPEFLRTRWGRCTLRFQV